MPYLIAFLTKTSINKGKHFFDNFFKKQFEKVKKDNAKQLAVL